MDGNFSLKRMPTGTNQVNTDYFALNDHVSHFEGQHKQSRSHSVNVSSALVYLVLYIPVN